MRRAAIEKHLSEGRGRTARRYGIAKPAGHFRKRKPLDCGQSRCGVYHEDKQYGHELTRDELLADVRHDEQLSELDPEPPDPLGHEGYSGCRCCDCD